MTEPRPPAGVDVRQAPDHCCALEWQVPSRDGAGHVMFRVHRPIESSATRAGRPARVEIRTGPASFGPDITDPAALRRMGWAFLSSCQLLAAVLEAQAAGPTAPGAAAGEPAEGQDPYEGQTTLFDQLVAAGLIPSGTQPQPQEARP